MTTNLEIALAVLVAVFGLATLSFVIYFVRKKCCRSASRYLERVSRTFRKSLGPRTNGPTFDAELDLHESDPRPPVASSLGHYTRDQHPVYSCRYRRQTLDVFSTYDWPDGQLRRTHRASSKDLHQLTHLAAVQEYYENLANEDGIGSHNRTRSIVVLDGDRLEIGECEVPVIEEVRVLPVARNKYQQLARLPSEPHVKPKSYYKMTEEKGTAGKLAVREDGVDVSHGMFISKTIDEKGGKVELYGAVLELPPGALLHAEKVCFGVLWTSDHHLQLSTNEAMLSPIVSCQPHGLQLQKCATLTLPHCAVDVQSDWTVTTWCSETAPTVKPDWRRMSGATVEVLPRRIKLSLDHFTLYGASGEGKDSTARKWIELVAFAPPLTGKQLPIRIYCLNDYTDDEAKDVKKMTRSEKKQGGKEMTSPLPLVFHNDGKNLFLKMDKMSESWSLSDVVSKQQEIDFELVWHALGPSCSFVLSSEQKMEKVECCFDGYQLDHEDTKQTIVVAQERQVTGDSRIDPELLYGVFPKELCGILMKMLDPYIATENNWIALADYLKMPLRDILWLEDDCRKSGRSPTVYLLNYWANLGKSLNDFEGAMIQLSRHDVQDEIEKWRKNH